MTHTPTTDNPVKIAGKAFRLGLKFYATGLATITLWSPILAITLIWIGILAKLFWKAFLLGFNLFAW